MAADSTEKLYSGVEPRWLPYVVLPPTLLAAALAGIDGHRARAFVLCCIWLALRMALSQQFRRIGGLGEGRRGAAVVLAALLAAAAILVRDLILNGWRGVWTSLLDSRGSLSLVPVAWGFAVAVGLNLVLSVVGVAATAARSIAARERPDVAGMRERLATVIYEATMLVWVLLASRGALSQPALLPGAALGAALGVIAWWHGDREPRQTRARLGLALVAAACNYAVVRALVVSAHDLAIERLLCRSSLDLAVGIPTFWIAAGAAAGFALLGADAMWRLGAMDLPAVAVLRIWARYDPTMRLHSTLRHLGHLLAGRWSPLPWIWACARRIWELGLGKLPGLLVGPKLERPRTEVFLRARAEECAARTSEQSRVHRAESLGGSANRGSLIDAASRERDSLIALQDYLLCPGCRHDHVDPEIHWEMAARWDELLWSSLPAGSRDEQPMVDAGAYAAKHYSEFVAACQTPGSQDQLSISIASMRTEAAIRSLTDVERHDLRNLLLEAVGMWRETDADRAALGARMLLSEYRLAGDWDGLVEAGWLLQTRAGYTLTQAERLDLGEAYWRQAVDLGPGEIGSWSWERALGHLYAAGAREHLQHLPPAFEEVA